MVNQDIIFIFEYVLEDYYLNKVRSLKIIIFKEAVQLSFYVDSYSILVLFKNGIPAFIAQKNLFDSMTVNRIQGELQTKLKRNEI